VVKEALSKKFNFDDQEIVGTGGECGDVNTKEVLPGRGSTSVSNAGWRHAKEKRQVI